MVELKRMLLIFITTPFMVLGVVWQVAAGGFMAGRIVTTEWTGKTARDLLAKRCGLAAPTNLGTGPKDTKGLH